MLVNINRAKHLELIGEMENSENKDYYLLIKVQPISQECTSDSEDVIQKVGVSNGMAQILSKEEADSVRHFTNE